MKNKMKEKIYTIPIPLREGPNILGEYEDIKIFRINNMYKSWKMAWRKGKRIDPGAVKYKNFISKKIEEFLKDNPNLPFDIKEEIFYSIKLDMVTKITKKWEIDQTTISDVDWYIKPIQDAFETDTKLNIKRAWHNDKFIKWFLAFIDYNKYDYNMITITLFDIKVLEKIKKLLKLD